MTIPAAASQSAPGANGPSMPRILGAIRSASSNRVLFTRVEKESSHSVVNPGRSQSRAGKAGQCQGQRNQSVASNIHTNRAVDGRECVSAEISRHAHTV